LQRYASDAFSTGIQGSQAVEILNGFWSGLNAVFCAPVSYEDSSSACEVAFSHVSCESTRFASCAGVADHLSAKSFFSPNGPVEKL
jgi:hypothetical protein